MASYSGSASNAIDSGENEHLSAGERGQADSLVGNQLRGSLASLKEEESSKHVKKSPYASTLQKLKRKVRKTYPVAEHASEVGSKLIPDNNGKSLNLSRYVTSTSAANTVESPSTAPPEAPNESHSFPTSSSSASTLTACDSSVQNGSKPTDTEYQKERELYAYEATEATAYGHAAAPESCQVVEPADYEPETPATSQKEGAAEKSYIYIDMSELFERPNLNIGTHPNLQAPCLYPVGNEERDAETTSNLEQGNPVTELMKNSPAAEGKGKGIENGIISSSSSKSFQYSDPFFPSLMQDAIRELAMDGQFADVTIEVDGHRIRCHRMILAASSKYFRAMFCNAYRERDQSSVTIQEVSADVMKVLIRYAYTSYLEVDRENVQSVLEAASLLQFNRVMEACSNYFVGELAVENAPGIMELAHRHNLKNLLVLARLKCVTCFEELRQKSDYLTLSAALLASLLTRNDLMVRSEKEVFEIVINWCQHCVEGRKHYLPQLLQHVKLPLIDPVYFVRHVETHPLIRNNPDVFDLMMEARQYRVVGDINEGSRIIPRHNAYMHQVFVTVGGCNKNDNFISEVSMLDFQHKTRATLCQLPNSKNSTRANNSSTTSNEDKTKWAEFACTAWKGNIVISGGKETRKEAWLFLTAARQWMELANINTGRWRHRMVVCNGELYVVGGYDGLLRVDSIEKYVERENCWFERRHMREGVSSAAVCECDDAIYVIGGGPSVRVSTEKVQVYNPEEDSWTISTPMPEPAKCINAVSMRGLIYVVGGILRKVLTFDSVNEVWASIGDPLISERASCGITLCGDLIFIVGGRDETGKAISNVSYLDPETKLIRSECNMSSGISHHGCVTLQKYDQIRSKAV